MTRPARRRIALWLLSAVVVLLLLAAAGMHVGARVLESKVEQALGPRGEVGAIELHWNAVELRQLRIRSAPGWPAADELRAERVRIEPDLRGLLSRRIRIARIGIDGGYLSALRGTAGGLRLLPALLDRKSEAGTAMPPITIDRVELGQSALELFDASVRRPPLRVRLGGLQASVGPIVLPDLAGRTQLDLGGRLDGPHRQGSLQLRGWIELATLDSSIATRLRGVDLVALQPYLVKAADAGIRSGTLDLDLDARVAARHLNAPGTVTLHDLELAEGGGFLGLPRQGLVAMMKDDARDITVRFTLDGRIDDPKFSLNENLAARMGAALASSLGLSLEGIARGAGKVGSTVGEAAAGVGKAFKGLFGH